MNKLLLFCIIIILPNISFALCIDYKAQINQIIQTKSFDQLKNLLPILKKEGCADNYISSLQLKLAQIVASKADDLMMAGKFEQAKYLLQHSAIFSWETQVIRADIAAFEGRWQKAAKLYSEALDLINDPQATPQAPDTEIIQKVFHLASEALILAGTLDDSEDSLEHGVMLGNVRGFKPEKLLIPIQFEFNKSLLSDEGKKSAQQLVKYIQQYDFKKITLIGHTDTKGSDIINDQISIQRALMLKKYLKNSGINIPITAIGQGKRNPLILNDTRYTEVEIDALNRRVEVITK